MCRCTATLALLMLSCGSSADEPTVTPAAVPGCAPGEREAVDGRCVPAGVQENGCLAGEQALDGGGCQPAGIPPDACAEGFSPEGEGCVPILPASVCHDGWMAVPGEARCRPVAPCASGDWGDIPTDGTTEFVNQAYTGNDSDGTQAKPWTRIQDGITAAVPGAIVAVAAGSYVEGLLLVKPVRLWGRCPSMVEVISDAEFAITVRSDSEVRDLAVSAGMGIDVFGTRAALLDRLWIHDLSGRGVQISDQPSGPTAAVVQRTLIESATELGILVVGADATIDATAVRETLLASDGTNGRGVSLGVDSATRTRGRATVVRSVVEVNHDLGVLVDGAILDMHGSVVRNTMPQASLRWGQGIHAQQTVTGERATLQLSASWIAGNRGDGISVVGADAVIDATVVRDTLPSALDGMLGGGLYVTVNDASGAIPTIQTSRSLFESNRRVSIHIEGADAALTTTRVRNTLPQEADGKLGAGIGLLMDPESGIRTHADVSASVVEHNLYVGLYVEGSDATITSTLVRDTRENEFARGIGIEASAPPFNERANVTIRESVVSDTQELGVFVNGAEAVIEASAIRDILPTSSQTWGRGIHVQEYLDSALPARVEVRHSVIERCFEAGLFVTGAEAQVASTLVRGIEAAPANDLYGDGIAVLLGNISPSAMTVDASRIEGCARAGLSSFGAITTMANTVLECNAIHLAGEVLHGAPASYQDLGGNVCGCAGDPMPCKVLSSNLAPPAASPTP